jgi:electron transfer flavoprotein beta subunit
MVNMRTVMPALQRAKPAKVGIEADGFLRVALPAQRRETRIVKDLPVDDIAREIVDWIGTK